MNGLQTLTAVVLIVYFLVTRLKLTDHMATMSAMDETKQVSKKKTKFFVKLNKGLVAMLITDM